MRVSRRALLGVAAGAAAATAAATRLRAAGPLSTGLNLMTSGAQPISAAEHLARLAKLQGLMQQRKIAAFLIEAGSSLEYFTGIRWW